MLEYQNHRLRMGRRPATINSEIGTLTHILKEGLKRGAIAAVPEVERTPQRAKKVDIPTEREIVRLIEGAPVRLRALLGVLSGGRLSPRRSSQPHLDAVDEKGGFAIIEPRAGWTPKTASSNRRLPLSKGLLAALREMRRGGAYVFPGRAPSKPMISFRHSLASAVKAAGLMRNDSRCGLPRTFSGKPMRRGLRHEASTLACSNPCWGTHPDRGSALRPIHRRRVAGVAITLPVWESQRRAIGNIRQHIAARA
jgi:integrase